MTNLSVGKQGEISLPTETRKRYNLTPDAFVRIIETRSGILIVPLSPGPMDPQLTRELEGWQELTAESWASIPYDDDEP